MKRINPYFLPRPAVLSLLLLLFFFIPSALAQNSLYSNLAKEDIKKKNTTLQGEYVQEPNYKAYPNFFDGRRWYLVLQPSLLLEVKEPNLRLNMPISFATSVQLSGGHLFYRWLQIGAGIGSSFFDEMVIYPIYGEIRGNDPERKVSPYYCVKAGGSWTNTKPETVFHEAWGGFMAEGQAGIEISFGKTHLLLGGGYHLQNVKLKGRAPTRWWGSVNERTQYRSFRRLLISSSVKYTF